MSAKSTIAGALALLVPPVFVIIGTLAQPTLSGDAAAQAAALRDHRAAVIAGLSLSVIAVAILIAGVIWLAFAVAPRAPRLAMAGGTLGVFGLLVVFFENSIAAASPALVGGLDPAGATAVLDRISSSAISAVEPLSILGDIGIALLGLAVVKAGAPRWAGAAIAAGALGEGAGFATGTKALVIISFAVLFAGLVPAVRTLAARPGSRLASEPAPAAAVS
jgi:hypothetical protein